MNIFSKLTTLFKGKELAEKTLEDAKDIKRGWKTPAFWITLFGNLSALAAATQGLMDPKVALMVTTGLTAGYNILRGMAKSNEDGVRGWHISTEVWIGIGAILEAAIMTLQQGGIDYKWLTTAGIVLAGVMKIARDLSVQQPSDKQ